MNGDIMRPKRPSSQPRSAPLAPPRSQGANLPIRRATPEVEALRPDDTTPPESVTPSVVPPTTSPATRTPKKLSTSGKIWRTIGALVLILIIAISGIYMWYSVQLSPVNSGDVSRKRIIIPSGVTAKYIASTLKKEGLIRDETVFDYYTRLSGTRDRLQAGTYSLSPSESIPEIVGHLISGKTDTFSITFYPGATLRNGMEKSDAQKSDVKSVLLRAGYKEEEIEKALNKTYDHPVFVDKPANTDLEGYVYGETYNFATGASVEDILKRTFDELYKVATENNLSEAYKKHNLTLYQGITLASLIEREVHRDADQKQVAQVFLKRLSEGTQLGSDVTFMYAAQKMGVAPRVDLDSPYNTRRVAGLPPGPIAAPGRSALLALAHPAPGDYEFFVAGDDGKTYFSRTQAEHEALTAQHCHELCKLP